MSTLQIIIGLLLLAFLYVTVPPLIAMNTESSEHLRGTPNGPRVAVTIAGQLRNWEEPFATLQKRLLPFAKCDIFLSVDEIPSEAQGPVLEKIRPKGARFGIPKEVDDHIVKTCGYPNVARMFYRIWAANELSKEYERQWGFTYDLVIRIRPDIHLLECFPFDQVPHDSLVIPELCKSCPLIDSFVGIQDQIAIGSRQQMDLYANVFGHYLLTSCTGQGFQTAEHVLWEYLTNVKGLPVKRIPLKWRIDDWTYRGNNGLAIIRKAFAKSGYVNDWLIFMKKRLSSTDRPGGDTA